MSKKSESKIIVAIRAWLETVEDLSGSPEELLTQSPKRWIVYHPMVLLPSGSFTSDGWVQVMETLPQNDIAQLWQSILRVSSTTVHGDLTHLAITEGIPSIVASEHVLSSSEQSKSDNVLRSPSQLRILYGDFGPATTSAAISDEDFERAFWVATRQNGIYQTWAPRWTMFSRGNVKEKARLLSFHGGRTADDDVPMDRARPASQLKQSCAVDLYAGIGYFVFSYAKLGMRVLCWELNPWSVEGLRRGALQNGWKVKVVSGSSLSLPSNELLAGDEDITVFLEDNRGALKRIDESRASGQVWNISHVNCGYLPTSKPTWAPSWDMTRGCVESWLHLHENVGIGDIPERRRETQTMFDGWAAGDDGQRTVAVQHVERVKTFAPGVMHCVFDVYVRTVNSDNNTAR